MTQDVASGSESFDAFYRREMPRLVTFARALCGGAACEDIAQESMLAMYRKWESPGAFNSPEAYVRRVCCNLATSHVRRRIVEARAVTRLAHRSRQAVDAFPDVEDFWSEVRRLPRRQAQAIALRYVYDLSVGNIAEILGCSEGACKVHLHRGRAALRDQLGRRGQVS